ncbi:MAG: UDP-N-acetylmuramate dehydrogenase [Pseudomonadota bacterium]
MVDLTQARFRGELRYGERLDKYTSWRVGGPADRFFQPADQDDLQAFLHVLPKNEPIFWIGLGSNLLVRDGGIRGTVISTRGRLKNMRVQDDGYVYVEAGVPCAHVARFCGEHGLTGAEFLAGIPGTFGGALAMNAGAFGGETWRHVKHVTTVDNAGRLRIRQRREFDVGYRSVQGVVGEWFLSAVLGLKPADNGDSQAAIRALLARRAKSQPLNMPSCGSVFKNPPRDFAARLIESSGLKGFRIGGACVSEKHANFILNMGAATAADIERLIWHVRDVVAEVHGVVLNTEVRIVGELLAGDKTA